jgi:hypothetical protein
MYLQTMLELSYMTDNIKFEWMLCDLLSSYKYKGLDPQSPGMKDNGKDATYSDKEHAIVFAFSIRKDWKTKFAEDFESAKKNNLVFKTFVFGSNQVLPAAERDKIRAEKRVESIEVDFYGAERIKVLLDTHYKKIRQIYLGIQDNSTIRRKIRNLLFDPENEVTLPERFKMFTVAAPNDMIGLFTLIKDEDLTMICETEEELTAFTTASDIMMHYRRSATAIDTSIFNSILNEYQIKTNMPGYYRKVLEYCNARLRKEDKLKVENIVTIAGYLGPTNDFCEKLYERLLEDQNLKALLDKLETIHQSCMKVRESVLALPGFRFEN